MKISGLLNNTCIYDNLYQNMVRRQQNLEVGRDRELKINFMWPNVATIRTSLSVGYDSN